MGKAQGASYDLIPNDEQSWFSFTLYGLVQPAIKDGYPLEWRVKFTWMLLKEK